MDNLKELLAIAEAVAKEKDINRDEVFNAIEEGMETALRKTFPEGSLVSVNIDTKTGDVKAYRLYKLVEQIENLEAEMLFSEIEEEIVEDGYVFEPFDFTIDRQKFNIIKQVTLQRIKHETREQQFNNLLDKPIALFSGTVKHVKKDQIMIDCNGLDVPIFRRSLLPRDNYKTGDKIYFSLEKDKNQYVGTRTSELYLLEALKREIIDIDEGNIEVVACARTAGMRSKVVVKSKKSGLDPIRACLGAKNSNLKNLNAFLNGEAIDFIAYNEDKAQLLINAMAPVNISHIVIDEEAQSMDISVPDSEVAQAIGRGGKNVEMVGKILGWEINVFSETQWSERHASEDKKAAVTFMYGLNCDLDFAQALVEEGYNSLDEIAYLPIQEFTIDGVDDETLEALRKNAKNTLDDEVLAQKALGAGELSTLGLSFEEIDKFQANDVINLQALAELASYEIEDIFPDMGNERSSSLVLAARSQMPEVETL